MSKSLFSSKMFWFNALTTVASVLPQAQEAMPDSAKPYVVPVVGLVNIVLRMMTSAPVYIGRK